MTFTPTDVTKAEVRITGAAPNQQLDFYIPAGPKGDLGPVPVISVGTVTTGNPTPGTPGAQGAGGPQGVQGNPGDLVTVVNTGAVTGTVTLVSGDLPSTRLWTLTGNVTLVLPTPSATKSGTVTLVMTQDATGSRTITWPANTVLKWPDGIAQQPAAAASTTSVIHLLWTGAIWLGLLGGKSFA